jgi:hypothetical protein
MNSAADCTIASTWMSVTPARIAISTGACVTQPTWARAG